MNETDQDRVSFSRAVDGYREALDRATLYICSRLKLRYLDGLEEATRELTSGSYADLLSPADGAHLKDGWDRLNEQTFTNEEVRLAWEELVVKGLKDARFPLSCLIPDAVSYLLASFANALYDGPYSVLDATMGTGSLLFTLKSYHEDEVLAVGIENERRLIQCARIGAALQTSSLQIYDNDLLKRLGVETDFLVAHLPGMASAAVEESDLYDEGVRYWPYLLLERRLENLAPGGHFAVLVPTDFFSQGGNELFKAALCRVARLDAVMTWPLSMFKTKEAARLLVIGTKEVARADLNTAILTLRGLDPASLSAAVTELRDLAQTIKEDTRS